MLPAFRPVQAAPVVYLMKSGGLSVRHRQLQPFRQLTAFLTAFCQPACFSSAFFL
jgi:hypothetical protein